MIGLLLLLAAVCIGWLFADAYAEWERRQAIQPAGLPSESDPLAVLSPREADPLRALGGACFDPNLKLTNNERNADA